MAVQGDFAAHAAMLRALGCEARLVRQAADLEDLAGLILPGGESTTMLRFLEAGGLREALVAAITAGGLCCFGTCAGLILMARQVHHPEQPSLGLIDLAVRRNGYGRQIDSFIDRVEAPAIDPEPLEGVFIRAPTVETAGPAVRVLGRCRGRDVLLQQGSLVAATFHPELTRDTRLHRYFLDLVRAAGGRPAGPSRPQPAAGGFRPQPASNPPDAVAS